MASKANTAAVNGAAGVVCRDGCEASCHLLSIRGYKPGQNRRRIELANDAFDIAKASRQRVHGNDIAATVDIRVNKAQVEK